MENPPDPGKSKPEPSSSEPTEQSSSKSVHHISRKMLVAGGSILSAIAIGAGTPLVVKVVDRYFLTPSQEVTTSSPRSTASRNRDGERQPCFAHEYRDPPRGLCHPGPVGPSPDNSGDNPCDQFEWYDVPANECVFVPEDQRPA